MRRYVGWLLLAALPAVVQLHAQQDELERHFAEGQQAIVENRYAEASAALEKALRLAPDIPELNATLGFSYFQQKRFAEAVPVLEKAVRLKPELPNVDVLLAASLSEMGRFGEAVGGLEKGFERASDPALRRLAGLQLQRAYSGLGRDREATAAALRMTELYPEDPEVLYHAGRLFGNYAFLTVQRLSRTAPDSVWAHQAQGEAFEADGQLVRALESYEAALRIEPRRPGLRFRLGRVLLRLEKLEEAVNAFEAELADDPTNANAAYELGEIHRKAGEMERARDRFRQAVERYPDFEQAQLALGGVLTGLDEASRALAHLEKAIELNPTNDVARYRIAQAYRALGRTEEMRAALADFEKLRKGGERQTAMGTASEQVTAQRLEEEDAP